MIYSSDTDFHKNNNFKMAFQPLNHIYEKG